MSFRGKKKILLAILGLSLLSVSAFTYLAVYSADTSFTCDACGPINAEEEYSEARNYLDENYPDENLVVDKNQTDFGGCGPCEGTSPTAFLVNDSDSNPEAIIIVHEQRVHDFINNTEDVPPEMEGQELPETLETSS